MIHRRDPTWTQRSSMLIHFLTLANSADDTNDTIKNLTFHTPISKRIMTRLRLSSVVGLQSRCSGRLRQGCRGPVCAVCARNLVSASRSNLSDSHDCLEVIRILPSCIRHCDSREADIFFRWPPRRRSASTSRSRESFRPSYSASSSTRVTQLRSHYAVSLPNKNEERRLTCLQSTTSFIPFHPITEALESAPAPLFWPSTMSS